MNAGPFVFGCFILTFNIQDVVMFSVKLDLYLIEPTVRKDCTGHFDYSHYSGGVEEGQERNQGKSSLTF